MLDHQNRNFPQKWFTTLHKKLFPWTPTVHGGTKVRSQKGWFTPGPNLGVPGAGTVAFPKNVGNFRSGAKKNRALGGVPPKQKTKQVLKTRNNSFKKKKKKKLPGSTNIKEDVKSRPPAHLRGKKNKGRLKNPNQGEWKKRATHFNPKNSKTLSSCGLGHLWQTDLEDFLQKRKTNPQCPLAHEGGSQNMDKKTKTKKKSWADGDSQKLEKTIFLTEDGTTGRKAWWKKNHAQFTKDT